MRWLVQFPRTVIYQPDHPIARREVVQLVVNSPTAQGAIIHALRTVEGDVEGLTATPFTGMLGSPPLDDTPDDIPIEIQVG